MDLHIPKMTCGGCLRSVIKAIEAVEPAAEVRSDLPARRITVTGARNPDVVKRALDAAGFPAVESAA